MKLLSVDAALGFRHDYSANPGGICQYQGIALAQPVNRIL